MSVLFSLFVCLFFVCVVLLVCLLLLSGCFLFVGHYLVYYLRACCICVPVPILYHTRSLLVFSFQEKTAIVPTGFGQPAKVVYLGIERR